MKKMSILAILLVFVLALTACGKEATPETTAATVAETTVATEPVILEPLELTEWVMSASTWSSPNGATIHISATPNYYAEGQKADFVIRLESDDVAMVPCQWDGSVYSASADLNAANGYCYYMILTATDGTVSEVAVNTPANPINEAYINMEAALQSYCSIVVEESVCDGSNLTLTAGKVQVQVPIITADGNAVTCQEASLVLSHNGQELEKKALTLKETEGENLYEADLADIAFTLPELAEEEQVELTLVATLSNGQSLSAYGGSWVGNTDGILPVVG
jgi:hypothetical protein